MAETKEKKKMSAFKAASLKSCEKIAKNMVRWRNIKERTQEYMADKTKIALSSIREYEENKTPIPVHAVVKYIDVLDVSASDLFDTKEIVSIEDDRLLYEYRKLSDRMQGYVYEMIKLMNS